MPGEKKTRLKVFATRIGIRDWVVAAPSQKAALAAWDVRDNLFASGAAWVVDSPDAIAVAMKTPGVPAPAPGQKSVRVGGANVVSLDSRRPKREPPAKPAPKRDRAKLAAAEAALAKHDAEAKRKRAEIERRKRMLEDEIEALDVALGRQRRGLEARAEKARRDYED
jgi:colicin import membrane protein